MHCNTIGDCFISDPEEIEQLLPIESSETIESDVAELITNDHDAEENKVNKKAVN